ncbi:MAG TPA: T9SS type A sorting domain-containing protein [Ignavibacteria bacterium]|nr:T9SS type A sorting domain-containing protein [Ignavibacteria bacterium]
MNWTQQYSAGSQNPEKIYMYNARIGFISDNSGSSSIRKTTNGGLTWNINVPGEWFYDIYFIDSLTGWRTRGDTMKFTSNGGSTWIKQLMPYGGMIFSSNLLRFSVLNKDTIWGSGGYMLYPNNSVKSIIFRTTNGGNNWLFQIPDTSLLPFEQYVKFTDKNHGWYYSINNTGIHTTTGGDPVWITAIEQISSEIPKDFKLYQNYPNPFNPDTKIKFQLLKHGNAEITIYDITGRRIQKLLNEELNAGEYEIDFNASGLSSGTYFYKLTVTTGKEVFTETKKMTLVK